VSARKPSVLVTGAAGFIGAHVTRQLLADGRSVLALDDLSGGFRDNLPAGAEFLEGSVTDDAFVRTVFETHRISHVFHLAAYAAEGLSHFIRRFNYTNNIIGSVNLINQAVRHDVESFVFTSSIAAYGGLPSPMRETDAPRPEDPYGIAKLAVELDLAAASGMFDLSYVVFRPHNVYGEYQNLGDPYRNVIGIFMNQIMQGRPMTIFGDGTQQRAFSYVGDIVAAIAGSAWHPEARNQVFNIGAETPYSVTELAQTVAEAMGQPGHPIEYLPARQEVHIAYSDHSKARRVFGPGPQTSLRDGVQKMAAWARTAGARQGKAFEGVEISRNLPPRWREITDLSPT